MTAAQEDEAPALKNVKRLPKNSSDIQILAAIKCGVLY